LGLRRFLTSGALRGHAGTPVPPGQEIGGKVTERSYQTDAIRVRWRSDRCIHSAICLDSLPEVFDATRRPWVEVTAADPDRIAETIRRCPSSALRYERLDGAPDEEPDEPPSIVPTRNGPLHVRGRIEIRDEQGEILDTGYRVALCRCGYSRNQPFCDLSWDACAPTRRTTAAAPAPSGARPSSVERSMDEAP
jgi:uncharacterized Fe-S cluster protein YjdI/CDGSH-type Zn-finger protein